MNRVRARHPRFCAGATVATKRSAVPRSSSRRSAAASHTAPSATTTARPSGGTGAAAFKADFCSRLPNLMTCSRVHVDVRTVKARNIDNNFENVASPRGGNQFCPGVGGSYVIVRATYQVPTLFPFAVTEKITVDGASVYIVQAARVFRNELFKGGVGGC